MNKASEKEKYQAILLTKIGAIGRYIQAIVEGNKNLEDMLREYYEVKSNPHEFLLQLANVWQGGNEGKPNYMQRILQLVEKVFSRMERGIR